MKLLVCPTILQSIQHGYEMNRVSLPLLICMLLLLPAGFAEAQVRISGRVVIESDGYPLPSATVQQEGSTRGTVTNGDGQFLLVVPALPVDLVVRYIGFRSERIRIEEHPRGPLLIEMKASSISLDEVFVTDENPAENIMRQVLLAKESMRKHLKSTYADTYTRFMLYSEMDLVQMNESVRASWWTPNSRTRELVRADRSRPARSGRFLFASPHNVPNFYDDDIDILGSRYAGPLHPDALNMYRYSLGERRDLDGQVVFDIYFVPKSATRPTFSGHLAVLDSVFAVLEVSARPHPGTVVLPPVQQHDVYLEQRFSSFGDSLWLPVDLFASGVVAFGRTGVNYPSARYEQISGLSLHVVNPPVPDSLSVPGPAILWHPLADRRDELFARNPSFIPMTPKETVSLATMDPSMTIDRAFRPVGLLSDYAAVQVSEDQDPEQAATQLGLVRRLTGGDWFWYNRVDGWHPGINYVSQPDAALQWRTSAGFSWNRKRISHRAELNIPWQVGGVSGYAGLQSQDATSVVARPDALGRFVPGFMTYLGYNDLYDYYSRRAVSFNIDLVIPNAPIVLSAKAHTEMHESLEKLTEFKGWMFRNEQRENPSINPGDLRSVEFVGRIGDRERLALDFSYERSPGSYFDSDWDFHRYEARGTIKFETFYRRRGRPNWLRITAMGGTASGDLPVQRQFTLSGSAGPFSDFTGFRTLRSSRFVADKIGGIFWAHDFTTALFEQLGLWSLADSGMGLYVFGGHAFSSRVREIGKFGGRFHEIGIGISYPFGMRVRAEVATGSHGGISFRFGRPLN